MSNLPVDRDSNYMREMWGTTHLITDYHSQLGCAQPKKQVLSEIMHDDMKKHNFKVQDELHQKIRNDNDYDDWEYGTEPSYISG